MAPVIKIKSSTDTTDDNINSAKRNVTLENFSEFVFMPKKTPARFINVNTSNAIGMDEKYHGRKLYDENVIQWKHPFTCKYYYVSITQAL